MSAREMTDSVVRVEGLRPIARPAAERLARDESARYAAALRELSADEWAAQTDNPDWDVRAMSGHVLGMLETFSSLRRMAGNMRTATKAAGDGLVIDALTALQVRRNASMTVAELIDRMETLGPTQARWRARRRLMRHMRLKQPNEGVVERWSLGFLVDIILTRDTFMHRIDLHRAAGRPLQLSAEHDGVIVADVVREWAARLRRPFTLHLTGPAGATYVHGTGGDDLELDAIEFCRILSGRGEGEGLLRQKVPF